MPFQDYRKQSRSIMWGTNDPGNLTVEQINLGCQLRIADAAEAMARNYTQLLDDVKWYQQSYRDEQAARQRCERRIASLRGVITKLKKRL